MSIHLDLKDHNILGPTYRRGYRQGLKLATRPTYRLLSRALTGCFGTLPPVYASRLKSMRDAELEQIRDRLMTDATLDEIFG